MGGSGSRSLMSRIPTTILARLSVGFALMAPIPVTAITWEKVAFSGEEAPGLPDTHRLELFDPPQVTNDGRVIIRGSAYAIHAWRSGEALEAIVSTGSFPAALPRTPCSFWDFDANPSGAIAFHAEEQEPGTTGCYEDAAYGPVGDEAILAARSGDAVPGEAGDYAFVGFTFSYKPSIAIDALGRVAFLAAIDDAATPGVSLETALLGPDAYGAPTQIARGGAPAFGDPWVRNWEDLLDFRLNDAGQVAFSGTLARSPFQIYAPTALHRHTPGEAPVVVMQTGEPAPGVPGAVFQAIGDFDLDDSGRVAFDALLDPSVGGVSLLDDDGIWVTDPDGVAILRHREGDAVPDVPGAFFGLNAGVYPFSAPRINNAGELAFSGWMLDAGVEVAGLWGPNAVGAPSLRVRGGDPAPGLAGVTLAWFELLAFNDEREILFVAHLTGDDIDETNDRAWYFGNAAGETTLLLREGDLLEHAPGDLQPVGSIDPQIGADPSFSRIAVLVDFDDSYSPSPTAIYSATVPEPAGGGVCALLALAFVARRARARRIVLGALVVSASGTTPFEANALDWMPIAHSGEMAPGFPGSHMETFEVAPDVSDSGQVFFAAFTPFWEEPSQILYQWSLAEGASIVAAAGSDEAGFDLTGLGSIHVNDAGGISYVAWRSLRCLYCPYSPEILVGPATVDELAVTAQSGDPAIGGPVGWVLGGGFAGDPTGLGPPFGSVVYVNQPVINAAGQMVAHAWIGEAELAAGVSDYEPGVSAEALYFFDPQTGPALIARAGDDAPGLPEGTRIMDFDWNQALGAGGAVAFRALTESVEGSSTTSAYRWSAATGLELLAHGGDAIPGDPESTLYGVYPPVVDAAGNVAFIAFIQAPGQTSFGLRSAIWFVDATGAMTLPVPFEAPAPGLADGAFFTYISDFLLADTGAIAFAANAELPDQTNTAGIWLREASGEIRKLFAEGDAAPGIPGATFAESGRHGGLVRLLGFAPHGALAFSGVIEGAAVDTTNDQVFYRMDANAVAALLVREGDSFEFAPGDVRPAQRTILRFDRDLAFAAAETASGDASALYFTAIPEPDAPLLGGIAIALLAQLVRIRSRAAS